MDQRDTEDVDILIWGGEDAERSICGEAEVEGLASLGISGKRAHRSYYNYTIQLHTTTTQLYDSGFYFDRSNNCQGLD